jgi:hypothetical protein
MVKRQMNVSRVRQTQVGMPRVKTKTIVPPSVFQRAGSRDTDTPIISERFVAPGTIIRRVGGKTPRSVVFFVGVRARQEAIARKKLGYLHSFRMGRNNKTITFVGTTGKRVTFPTNSTKFKESKGTKPKSKPKKIVIRSLLPLKVQRKLGLTKR